MQRRGSLLKLLKRHVKRGVRRETAVPGHPVARLRDRPAQLLGQLAVPGGASVQHASGTGGPDGDGCVTGHAGVPFRLP